MATWKELDRYCQNDGWECYKITDHKFYRKKEGNELRLTKVSFGSGEIPKQLFNYIVKQQLNTTKEEFNKKI